MLPSTVIVKIGKKRAVYIPKKILKEIGADEGDFLRIRVERGKIIMEPIQNPFKLAINSKKWITTTIDEIEMISEEEQELYG